MRRRKWLIGGVLILLLLCFGQGAAKVEGSEESKTEDSTESGTCGDNISWILDDSGTLTISGQGAMEDTTYSQYGWTNLDVYQVIVEEGITYICQGAFSSGKIDSVTLPSTLISIGDGAFGYSGIGSIELPEGLTTIGKRAFAECRSLTEITIPSTVTSIGEKAFSWCSNLTKASLPEGITTIPEKCFEYCGVLTDVNIPSTVTVIEDEAFDACFTLEKVILPEGLKEVGAFAFCNCGITELTFPSSLTTVGRHAFDTIKASSLVIPETMTDIGEGAFASAFLTSVTIPSSMTVIPRSMFDWSALVRVYLPNGVETIETNAFRGNIFLKTIRIPLSVTKIESGAFWNDWGIDIFYEGSEEDWNNIDLGLNNGLDRDTIHYNCVGEFLNPEAGKTITFHAGFGEEGSQDIDLTIPWSDEMLKFEATSYHNDLAIPCLALSGAVEVDPARAETMLETFGFEKEHIFAGYFNTEYNYLKPAAVFGYKQIEIDGQSKNLFVIIVRGTTNGSDVLTDLSAAIGGFAVASEDMKERFVEFVEDELDYSYEEAVAKSTDNILLVTGHSLGGAIANHLSVDLMGFAPKDKFFVYTFAAPQSFPLTDREYRFSMDNVFNVVNTVDKVPYLPPIGYYRIGSNRYFASYWEQEQYYFQRLTSGITYQEAYDSDWGWALAPHSVEAYMAHLMVEDRGSIINQVHPRVAKVACPVNVEVYDENGTLVGRIVDNTIDASVSTEVGLYVEEETKYVILLEDKEYTFKLIGTDEGTMTYSLGTIDPETDEFVEEAVFENVALSEGKSMVSEIENTMTEETNNDSVKLFVVNEDNEPIAQIFANGQETSLVEEEPERETENSSDPEGTQDETSSDSAANPKTQESSGETSQGTNEEERDGLFKAFTGAFFRTLMWVFLGLFGIVLMILIIVIAKRNKDQ